MPEITVKGMSCGHCVAAMTKAMASLPGVSQVQVDLGSGRVSTSAPPPSPGRTWTGWSRRRGSNWRGDKHRYRTFCLRHKGEGSEPPSSSPEGWRRNRPGWGWAPRRGLMARCRNVARGSDRKTGGGVARNSRGTEGRTPEDWRNSGATLPGSLLRQADGIPWMVQAEIPSTRVGEISGGRTPDHFRRGGARGGLDSSRPVWVNILGGYTRITSTWGVVSGLAKGLNSGRVSIWGGPCSWRCRLICWRMKGVKGRSAWRGKAMPFMRPRPSGPRAPVDRVGVN